MANQGDYDFEAKTVPIKQWHDSCLKLRTHRLQKRNYEIIIMYEISSCEIPYKKLNSLILFDSLIYCPAVWSMF